MACGDFSLWYNATLSGGVQNEALDVRLTRRNTG